MASARCRIGAQGRHLDGPGVGLGRGGVDFLYRELHGQTLRGTDPGRLANRFAPRTPPEYWLSRQPTWRRFLFQKRESRPELAQGEPAHIEPPGGVWFPQVWIPQGVPIYRGYFCPGVETQGVTIVEGCRFWMGFRFWTGQLSPEHSGYPLYAGGGYPILL